MGLFDNIIGTANDGEAATDMDTIIDSIAKGKLDAVESVEQMNTDANPTGGSPMDDSGDSYSSTGGSGGTGDDKKDDKKKKKDKKNTDTDAGEEDLETVEDIKDKTDTTDIPHDTAVVDETEIETEIDIGGDMSAIDLGTTDEVVVSNTENTGDTIKIVSEQAAVPAIDIGVTIAPPSVTPVLEQENTIPASIVDTPNPDTMSTEPVISLLSITESAPQVGILDIGMDTMAPLAIDTPPIAMTPEPIISPIVIAPDIATPPVKRSPAGGSLGEKIGGFADELRGLRAADELLLQEKQDAKKRLEDAKKAIEDAEMAIDTEIQRIRDDEAAIDDTLASLQKR